MCSQLITLIVTSSSALGMHFWDVWAWGAVFFLIKIDNGKCGGTSVPAITNMCYNWSIIPQELGKDIMFDVEYTSKKMGSRTNLYWHGPSWCKRWMRFCHLGIVCVSFMHNNNWKEVIKDLKFGLLKNYIVGPVVLGCNFLNKGMVNVSKIGDLIRIRSPNLQSYLYIITNVVFKQLIYSIQLDERGKQMAEHRTLKYLCRLTEDAAINMKPHLVLSFSTSMYNISKYHNHNCNCRPDVE